MPLNLRNKSISKHYECMNKENVLNLPSVKATPKSGEENLTFNGENIGYKLINFWQWSTSNILSNATRGKFAEFMVGTAIELDSNTIRDEWSAYDLESKEGVKIEVKSASYIQSWKQKNYSNISFSIKPSKHWDPEIGILRGSEKRHADVYVFCLLKNKDQKNIDPVKLEQWSFFVLPTYRIDGYKRSQRSITINSLSKQVKEIQYSELKEEISKAYFEQIKNKK